jgi:hypothetical protein
MRKLTTRLKRLTIAVSAFAIFAVTSTNWVNGNQLFVQEDIFPQPRLLARNGLTSIPAPSADPCHALLLRLRPAFGIHRAMTVRFPGGWRLDGARRSVFDYRMFGWLRPHPFGESGDMESEIER